MNYDSDSNILIYPLIKDYIRDVFSNGSRIEYSDAFFYPLLLDSCVGTDNSKVISYQRRMINTLAVSIIYNLLPAADRKLFYFKHIKPQGETRIICDLDVSSRYIKQTMNRIYTKMINILCYRISQDDLLDSRYLLNMVNILDMRISIMLRYGRTDSDYYHYLVGIREQFSKAYIRYTDLYQSPKCISAHARVLMAFDFDRDISIKFLAAKLKVGTPYIYFVLSNSREEIGRIFRLEEDAHNGHPESGKNNVL